MKFELDTHPGLIIENPEVVIDFTVDFANEQKFQPHIIFVVEPNIRIAHTLPKFDYVNGGWFDEDVDDAISSYLDSINIE
jgi:hypothetical protein